MPHPPPKNPDWQSHFLTDKAQMNLTRLGFSVIE